MDREYGQVSARKIRERLNEIDRAKNLKELKQLKQLHPRLHERAGAHKGLFSVDLDHPFRMIIMPDYDPVPLLSSGGIDLEKVERIEVVRAKIDDHGKRKGL